MASVINILPQHVADMIAAGEVVERPASVVKELAENSIDAGADQVTIEISRGGMGYVRVSDNGCGMSPEDAGIAFLRHATSKTKGPEDLEAIRTMGFRGEALAAISSVSRIELRTRKHGEREGTRVVLTAGEIDEMTPFGCPEGTIMQINDLFYNTPARLKFMKSDKAEGTACLNAALHCALAHPDVKVRFIRDREEIFFSPGDGKQESCIYSLLGREAASTMLRTEGGNDKVQVEGYISSPRFGRGNRQGQYFFVNGRPFRSTAVQAALEQAYKNTLLTGRFPQCVLWLKVSYGQVDVNVHPTKTEVKFSDEKSVFDAVYYSALTALREENILTSAAAPAQRKPAPVQEPAKKSPAPSAAPSSHRSSPSNSGYTAEPNMDFFRTMTSEEYKKTIESEKHSPGSTSYVLKQKETGYKPSSTVGAPATPPADRSGPVKPASSAIPASRIPEVKPPAAKPAAPVPPTPPRPPMPKPEPLRDDPAVEETPQQTTLLTEESAPAARPFRVLGEVLKTYIVAEIDDELVLIDKHAAHERMLFERLKKTDGAMMSQVLLEPIAWTPGEEVASILLNHPDELTNAGFGIESFGQGSIIIRSVPEGCEGEETASLEEIAERLRIGHPGDARDDILHTIACKAATKAGKHSDIAELTGIAEAVARGEVKYCPHGRPVAVPFSRKELDKLFKRIV